MPPRPPRSPRARGFRALGKQQRHDLAIVPNTRQPRLPKLPNTGFHATQYGPAIFRAAPRIAPWPDPPAYWGQRSELEWICCWYLINVAKKYPSRMPDGYPGPWGEDFTYQAPFEGGRVEYGGIVVDIVLTDGSQLAWNPLGFHWHAGFGTGQQARDIAAKADLLSRYGILLIFLEEDALRRDPFGLLKDALAGIDHSGYAHMG